MLLAAAVIGGKRLEGLARSCLTLCGSVQQINQDDVPYVAFGSLADLIICRRRLGTLLRWMVLRECHWEPLRCDLQGSLRSGLCRSMSG